MIRQEYRTQLAIIKQMSRQVSHGSAGEYQQDEQAGVARLHWRVSGRLVRRCRVAQLASIRQMSRQVSLCSADDYQADEQAGVAGLTGDYQTDEQAGVVRVSWRL